MSLPMLRLPPDGPPLGEVPGNAFTGYKLRTSEAVDSVLAMPVTTGYAPITDLDGVAVAVALVTPSRTRRYSVRCHFGATTVTDSAGRLDVELQATYDGTTWFTAGGNSISCEAASENIAAYADMPMTLGSALGTPVPDPAPTLIGVRVRVRASADSIFTIPTATGFGNRALLTLSELA